MVDIDLTYIKLDDRNTALNQLALSTERIASQVERRFPLARVTRQYSKITKQLMKLIIDFGHAQVKIEPNELMRGSIYPVHEQKLASAAEEEFGAYVAMHVLSYAEL